jgi:hypothetical protein
MKAILFVSTVTDHFDTSALRQIIATASENNRRSGITGLLLFNGMNFLQLIEGPDIAVDECLRRISKDHRHSGVIPFGERKIVSRQCRGWRFVDTRKASARASFFLEEGTQHIVDQFHALAA